MHSALHYTSILVVALSVAPSLRIGQAAGGQDHARQEPQSVIVVGTAFQIREGSRLFRQDELKGSILTINDDTIMSPDFLKEMVEIARQIEI